MKWNGLNARNAVIDGPNEYLKILDETWQAHLAPKGTNAPTFISLFSGCGGSSLGYSMAGYRELLAVDWNKNAIATFKFNFPDVPVWQGDIYDLTIQEILDITELQIGELDLLDGSPPCQGFSTAGKRQITDPRNQLYNEYVRILEGLQPKVFVMENVPGMIKGKMKLVFADCMRKLKRAGYRVRCKLLNTMYFNVPQKRERLIWIGIRNDLSIELTYPDAKRRPFSIAEALANLLFGVIGQISPFTRADHVRACRNEMRFSAWKSANDPASTMTANRPPIILLNDDGGKKTRQLIDRECARIQSFPNDFRFVGKQNIVQEQIGNSVPPLFMKAIAEHIRQKILCLADMSLTPQLADG